MRALLLVLLISACDPPPPPPPDNSGKIGYACYKNRTCDGGAACISWKQDGKMQSVCAVPQEIAISSFDLVKCVEECPPTKCPELQLHCPPLVTCPPPKECPKMPMGPCQECPACVPGWKR